jgi:hypothetical protein
MLKLAFVLPFFSIFGPEPSPGKCGRSLKIVSDLKSTRVWLLDIDGIELPNIILRTSRIGLSMVTISERAQQIR